MVLVQKLQGEKEGGEKKKTSIEVKP